MITVKNTPIWLEAQDGKDVCDHKIGPLRQHIHFYVSEGHDVDIAQKMNQALDDGVRPGVYKLPHAAQFASSKWKPQSEQG